MEVVDVTLLVVVMLELREVVDVLVWVLLVVVVKLDEVRDLVEVELMD